MSYNPFFSIIVPVYRAEKYLDQCVQSVMNQTFSDFELILVDDGSPDQCPVMCEEYVTKDKRIKAIHKPNGGLSDARNAGLKISKGAYIIFLDSDDFWCDNQALEKINKKLINTNLDVLIFGMRKYYQKENRYADIRVPVCDRVTKSKAQTTKRMIEQNVFVACAWDKVVKQSFIKDNSMFFVKGQLSEDIEWCCKLLLGMPAMDVISEAFYVYRQQNENSITANIGRKNLVHINGVLKEYSEKAQQSNCVELLNFLAIQYVLWLTVSNGVDKKEIQDLLLEMRKYWYLVAYTWNKRVAMVYSVRFLGFAIIRKLLGVYKRIK